MPTVLSARGLHKTFRQKVIPVSSLQERILRFRQPTVTIEAVRDASFALARGEWLGICGNNGSGKTTLLKMLAGLLHPDAGEVLCDGTVSCFLELGAGFHPERSAEENVRIHSLLHGIPSRQIDDVVERVIAFAGVETHRLLPLKCFSTGMRLRLGFASVAHVDSDIYLFDEAAAVGDQEFGAKCVRFYRDLKRAGKSAILVCPAAETLTPFCDRILTMRDGRLTGAQAVSPAATHRSGAAGM